MLACNVVCSIDGLACQATAEACTHAFRVRWHREREDPLLRKTIHVDIEEKSTGEQSDAEQSDSGQSLGGRGKRRRPGVRATMNKKKAKPPPVRVGQAAEVAPGLLEQMREAHKREVEALQQSHAAELKRLEAASKTREDQWPAREANWETERKSLQDQVLKAPKPQAGSGTVAGVGDEGDSAGTTRYLREAAGAMHGSLTSAVTALQCTSWLIDTLGKEKGPTSPPVAVDQYKKLLENYSVESIVRGGGSSSQGEA